MFLTWGFLLLNVLAFYGNQTVVPIPQSLGKAATQGALLVAFVLALALNRGGVVRPQVTLALLTILGVVASMLALHNQFVVGSNYRGLRNLGFLAVLWLLTPWFLRRDMLLLRVYRFWLWVVVGQVLLGAVVAPGVAFSFEGRLSGALWPVPPTQVAHYAAILLGTSILLWMTRVISNRNAGLSIVVTSVVLVATHTRTALGAMAVGLACAIATLLMTNARARRTVVISVLVVITAVLAFAAPLTTWLLRGQSTSGLLQLTGRTDVWTSVLAVHRTPVELIFGTGPSNFSWQGLPIDSNWIATYLDQGLFGIAVQVALMLFLLFSALVRAGGPQKSIAVFLVIYCIVASITETTLAGPSPYVLEIVLASALLMPRSPW